MFNYCLAIPARFNSSRLPGKPLLNIKGKKLIERVWLKCLEVVPNKRIFILTDDKRIYKFCSLKKMNVIMTSKKNKTGTDRIFEFSKKYNFECYINVQGDEPLIDTNDIRKFIKIAKNNRNLVYNGMTKIKNKKDFYNYNIPKVVTNERSELLYMSRAPIPINKKGKHISSFKQVCIYSFPKNKLNLFGKFKKKSKNENIEDIEILRFVDNGIKVKMIEFQKSSIAVDTVSDLIKVRKIVKD